MLVQNHPMAILFSPNHSGVGICAKRLATLTIYCFCVKGKGG